MRRSVVGEVRHAGPPFTSSTEDLLSSSPAGLVLIRHADRFNRTRTNTGHVFNREGGTDRKKSLREGGQRMRERERGRSLFERLEKRA